MVNDAATKSRKITEKQPWNIQDNLTKINKKCSIILVIFDAPLIFESLKHFWTNFTFTILVFVYKSDATKD